MKIIAFLFLILSLTACSQNIGYGIGVAGVGSSGDGIAGAEIHTDSEIGTYGSVGVGTDIRL